MNILELRQCPEKIWEEYHRMGDETHCCVCQRPLRLGEEYLDGGEGKQAHTWCVPIAPMNGVKVVPCCADCHHWAGWYDNMSCLKFKIGIEPYWICDAYEAGKTWIVPNKSLNTDPKGRGDNSEAN